MTVVVMYPQAKLQQANNLYYLTTLSGSLFQERESHLFLTNGSQLKSSDSSVFLENIPIFVGVTEVEMTSAAKVTVI